jgi:hypothetical protein
MWKNVDENILAYLTVLSQHLPQRVEKNHEKIYLGYVLSRGRGAL